MNGYGGSDFRPRGINASAALLAVIAFALAALSIAKGANEGSYTFIILGVVLVLIGMLIPASLKMANQWERAVVLRLGKLHKIAGPGLFVIVPIIDSVQSWLDQRIQTTEFNAEQALSKDTVPVDVDAVIF